MISALLLAATLQATSAPSLALEAEQHGRISTVLSMCSMYYSVNLMSDVPGEADFARRTDEAGWSVQQHRAAVDRGRELERAEFGLVADLTGMTPSEARRRSILMRTRLKTRCREVARQLPGSITDLEQGDRKLNAELRELQ